MAASDRRHDLEGLLAGARWVRALANGLVHDAASADDLVQDAWVVALTRPERPADPRAWLAGVVRHLARRDARTAGRRRRREATQARPEALPSTDELVERSELQERLSAAVRALDEPYRTTVLLHYAEGLTLEQIARRQRVPASTVRTRHARALARLRERLDAGHGGRASWLAAFAPLAAPPVLPLAPAATTATLGNLAMGAKTGLGLAAIAAGVAVLAVSVALRESPRIASVASTGADPTEMAVTDAASASAPTAIAEVDARGQQSAGTDREPAAAAGPLLLFGALTTRGGEEVPGANVRLWNEAGERRDATDAPGSWSIVGLPPGTWTVAVDAQGFYPLRGEVHLAASAPETRHDLVLDPARVLRIRFVDAQGRTVIDASTRSHPLMPGLGAVATRTAPGPRMPGVDGRMPELGDAGRYRSPENQHVEGLPPGCAGLLELIRPPPVYVSAVLREHVLETRVDDGVGEEMVFVLDEQALRAQLAGLTARLVDARSGAPLEGMVTLTFRDGGGRSVRADADGVLRFEEQVPGLRRLQATLPGHELLDRFVRLEPGQELDLGEIALDPASSLEGWLVDEEGRPIAQRLRVTSDDRVVSPLDVENAVGALVHGDGHFELWSLGSGEPLLLVRHEDYAVNPLQLETDAEGRTQATARRGTPVVLRHGRGPEPGLRFALADASGRPFWTRRVYDEAPIRLRLVPGRYQLLEGHDEVFTPVRDFEVGDRPLVIAP